MFNGVSAPELVDFIRPIEGIEEVLGREAAATRFDLPFDLEGDIVVISREHYCVGMGRDDHDLTELNGERLRSHGGISERDVPFAINRPLNAEYLARAKSEQLNSYHIFDFAINGTA